MQEWWSYRPGDFLLFSPRTYWRLFQLANETLWPLQIPVLLIGAAILTTLFRPRGLGRPATLDDIPDAELDRLAEMGFDWVWFLSVWQTGAEGQRISRSNPEWRHEFQETLPDLREDDIPGSGFAITGYTVHQSLGGDAALARLRERLRQRGLKLMLDFVPNHVARGYHSVVKPELDFGLGDDQANFFTCPK